MADPPKKPPQDPSLSFDQLYRQAQESQPLLSRLATDILAEMKRRYPDKFESAHLEMGPMKSYDRASAKIESDYRGERAQVTDLVRARIIVDTPEQAQLLQQYIIENQEQLRLNRMKPRFAEPSNTNYRDVLTNVRLENGHVAELRIENREMVAAGKLTHAPYERAEEIRRNAQTEGRLMTNQESMEYDRLMDKIRDTHQVAADKAGLNPLLNDKGRTKVASFDNNRVTKKSNGYFDDANAHPGTTQTPHKPPPLHGTTAKAPTAPHNNAPVAPHGGTPTHPTETLPAHSTPKLPATTPTRTASSLRYSGIRPRLSNAANGAQGAAAALGVYGVYNRASGQLQEDWRQGGTQAAAGTTAMAADGLNATGGVVSLVVKLSPKLAESGLGTVSKFAGKAAIPLAVIATGADMYVGVKNNDPERVAGAGGGLLGGILVGAAAGALCGAETGPGAIITGIVGGVVGGFVGEAAAKKFLTSTVRSLMGSSPAH
jgi:hypothetical protein